MEYKGSRKKVWDPVNERKDGVDLYEEDTKIGGQ